MADPAIASPVRRAPCVASRRLTVPDVREHIGLLDQPSSGSAGGDGWFGSDDLGPAQPVEASGAQVLDEMRQRRLPPLLPMIVILPSSFGCNTESVGHPHAGR